MSIINKISDNNLRFIIVVLSFIFLLLSFISFENNVFSRRMTTDDCLWIKRADSLSKDSMPVITQIIPGGVADKAGLIDGDILLEINGVPVSYNTAMEELNKYQNEYITYTILRNGELFRTSIWVYKFVSIGFIIFWLVGLSFLIVGTLVGYSKPKELTTRLFFILSCAASIGLVNLSGTNPFGMVGDNTDMIGYKKLYLYVIRYFYIFGMVFMFPLYIHFFVTFPKKLKAKPRLVILLISYILIIIILIIRLIPQGQSYEFNSFMNFVARYIPILYIATGTAIFFISFRQIDDLALRKSYKIIRNGFIIGGTGLIYFFIFITINKQPIFLINPLLILPNILLLAIPISFGYSIIKYRILDTEFIVKRSLIFSLVTIFIILLYLLLVFLMNSYLKDVLNGSSQVMIITFIVIFVFSFDYVNKLAQAFVDKQFFRENYNYRQLLLNFSKEISYISKIEELVLSIREFLKSNVQIENFKFRVLDDKYIKALDLSRNPKLDNLLVNLINNKDAPLQINASNINSLNLSTSDKELINIYKIKLLIPVVLKNKVIGVLLFGMKSSGKAYSDEDIDLLKSFASQSAISLENSRLNYEQINKQRYQEELNIALKIQSSILPKDEEIHTNLEFCGYSQPARNIGGDFYDIIKKDEDKVYIAIADVSDKGIPAALYMSQVQAMLQFATQILDTPVDILKEVNKQVYEQFDKFTFVTILMVMLDFKHNLMRVARAGHTPLIKINNQGIEHINPSGLGAGIKENEFFSKTIREGVYEFSENDIFFMYSDGLTEFMDEKRNMYGEERLLKVISSDSQNNINIIKENILGDLKKFNSSNLINDDITFLLFKIKNNNI